jgi:hypothetical protein
MFNKSNTPADKNAEEKATTILPKHAAAEAAKQADVTAPALAKTEAPATDVKKS